MSFIVIHILKEIELFKNMAKLNLNIFQFISFDREVLLDDVETALLALLMFFNTFKVLYLFKFNSHVRQLSHVLKTSTLELINCSLGFFVFMLAFTHFGFLQFGRELLDYSTPISSLQSLLIQAVVNERVQQLHHSHTIIGPLFFITFNIGLHFLWINLFIAILIYDYRTAKQVTKGRYTLGRFMMNKLREVLNCLGDNPETPQTTGRTRQTGKTGKTRNNGMAGKKGKKGVTWKLEDIKQDMSREDYSKVVPAQVEQLGKLLTQATKKLNNLYVDDFSTDVDLVDLWLDLRARRRNATEKRAGTHSEKVSWEIKDGSLASVPAYGVKLKKDGRTI